jgi:hypothetical protein
MTAVLAAWALVLAPSQVLGPSEDRQVDERRLVGKRHSTGHPRALADAMRGTCVRLSELDEMSVLPIIRGLS